jgi:hypothetical protein
MAIMVRIRPSDCPDCYSAYRPTTNETGLIEKSHIPKRIQKIVETRGAAWAYPPSGTLKKGENQ